MWATWNGPNLVLVYSLREAKRQLRKPRRSLPRHVVASKPTVICILRGCPMGDPRYRNGSARRKLRARLRHMVSHCPMCGVALDWEHPYQDNSAELDEIWPLSKTPPELRARAAVDPSNVQVLCRRCNKLKGARTPQQLAIMQRPSAEPDAPIKTSRKW